MMQSSKKMAAATNLYVVLVINCRGHKLTYFILLALCPNNHILVYQKLIMHRPSHAHLLLGE